MSTLVRVDRVSGYKWVDFYVDQGARWPETVTWWPGADGVGSPVDLSGYSARLVVIRAGVDALPVLDLASPNDITLGGSAGTTAWDVVASRMALFTHPVYQHELTLFPSGDDDLAIRFIKGRVLVRASVTVGAAPTPTPGSGWGHGGWGHGPWGGSS